MNKDQEELQRCWIRILKLQAENEKLKKEAEQYLKNNSLDSGLLELQNNQLNKS